MEHALAEHLVCARTFPADWPAPPTVHACTTRRIPELPCDFDLGRAGGSASEANRRLLARALALPDEPLWLRQVHGTRIVEAPGADTDTPADGSATAVPGQVLAVLTADCLPIALCDVGGTRIGLAHAGWRGLAAGIVERAVAALGVPGDRLLAWLGPAIGPAAFEVGDEVREAFLANDPGADAAFTATRAGHWLADLYMLARRRLRAAGVTRTSGGSACTFSMPGQYFSYRRDATKARMATLVWMSPRTGAIP